MKNYLFLLFCFMFSQDIYSSSSTTKCKIVNEILSIYKNLDKKSELKSIQLRKLDKKKNGPVIVGVPLEENTPFNHKTTDFFEVNFRFNESSIRIITDNGESLNHVVKTKIYFEEFIKKAKLIKLKNIPTDTTIVHIKKNQISGIGPHYNKAYGHNRIWIEEFHDDQISVDTLSVMAHEFGHLLLHNNFKNLIEFNTKNSLLGKIIDEASADIFSISMTYSKNAKTNGNISYFRNLEKMEGRLKGVEKKKLMELEKLDDIRRCGYHLISMYLSKVFYNKLIKLQADESVNALLMKYFDWLKKIINDYVQYDDDIKSLKRLIKDSNDYLE